MEKSIMGYVLIEIEIGEPLPDMVDFASEKDELLQVTTTVIHGWLTM